MQDCAAVRAPRPRDPGRAGHARRALGVALACLTLAGCGDGTDEPTGPPLTADQNGEITSIAEAVREFCFRGGADATIKRELESLLALYRQRPRSVYRSEDGERSSMREVMTATAEQLEACGAPAQARQVRRAL